MIVDRAWAERNIGFDPASTTAPVDAFAHRRVAAPDAEPDDFQREIIDFDSEGPEEPPSSLSPNRRVSAGSRISLARRVRSRNRPEA